MTKRALCVGINDYPGTNSDLSGCVNDAEDWAQSPSRNHECRPKRRTRSMTEAA